MHNKTFIEKAASSMPASIAANAVSAFGSPFTPWAAFAPFLLQTMASKRQSERVEKMLTELAQAVSELQIDMHTISDDQYKLAGECVVAAFSTVDQRKLDHIRNVVLHTLLKPELSLDNSDALGRLIRDISAAEVVFLLDAFRYEGVSIDAELTPIAGRLMVKPNSPDELHIGGLIRLGLLYSRSTNWDSMMYEWSPLTAKFIALISSPNESPQPI